MASNDFKAFARKMKGLGKEVEVNTNKMVVATASAINTAVVIATPVDTGRARANWQAGINSDPNDTVEQTDKGGTSTINTNNATIRSRRARQTVFLSNNLDYIASLDAGSSAQAPENFVARAVQAGIKALARARILPR